MIGGVGIAPNGIADSMVRVSDTFNKNSRIRPHHFIVSFARGECADPGVLYCIGMEISRRIGQEYQIAFALHEDTDYPHLHFVFNAVSYVDGHKYRRGKKEYMELYHFVRGVIRGFRIEELMSVNYHKKVR